VLQGWKIPPHIPYAGRGPSASPAAGFASVHAEEQSKLVEDALNLVRPLLPFVQMLPLLPDWPHVWSWLLSSAAP
jgi:2-oxoglutarate dehydrogenase C-terminal